MQSEDADRAVGAWPSSVATAAMALARRFAAGATLWCWSPAWPHHAEHVAVEFVHPVIVGKPALPAVAVTDPEPVAALRAMVAPGDVVLVVAGGGDPAVAPMLRRAAVWGATTVWVGAGERAPGARADHVLWSPGDDALAAAATGAFVLSYHVLWELTHVCLEHPGLVRDAAGTEDGTGAGAVCVTCSDEGRPGEVVATSGTAEALVRTAAGVEYVDATLAAPVIPGDIVLVHAGVAIAHMAEADR